MSRLQPKSITLESSLKFFGLDSGRSDGSSTSITFEIPPDMSSGEFRKALLEEKEQLDLLVATMELAKGTFARSKYENYKSGLRATYDKLLKRNGNEE